MAQQEAINRVAVIGAGLMGHGIAQVFAAGGSQVRCFDEAASIRESVKDRIRRNLENLSANELFEASEIGGTLERLEVSQSLEGAVNEAQFVIEAVKEDLAIKQALLERIEAGVAPDTILASNSSTIPISQSAAGMQRPERALIVHFMCPPFIVPVVEIVPGPKTAKEVVDASIALVRQAGNQPVRINKEVPGFVVNRIQVAMYREIFSLLEQSVISREDLDVAISGSVGFRLAMSGPLQVMDFGGVNLWERVYGNLCGQIADGEEVPQTIRELVAQGNFGPYTGKGLFDYSSKDINATVASRENRFIQLRKLLKNLN